MQKENEHRPQELSPSLQKTLDFIVVATIKSFFFVCIPLTTLSLARIIKIGFIPVMGLHVFLLVVLSFCFFCRKRLSSTFLSLVIVIIFFLLALGGFYTFYITVYLLPATILSLAFAALLLSKRMAIIALLIEGTIMMGSAVTYSKLKVSQSIFEVLCYCAFSYFLIFAIDTMKVSFLILINNLKEKEKAEKKANKNLSIALESRSRFLALMSHEIRTPLNSILLASENLHSSNLNQEQLELIEVIESSNYSIQTLIKDILDFTKGESGKNTIETSLFNLKKKSQQIIELIDHQNKSTQVSLQFQYDLKEEFYLGDQVKISQIITNLTSNAMKFTIEGEVILRISKNEETENIIISVADTGVGIEEARLSAIFNEFEQEDNSTTRLFGGTGLGLAIVKQAVNLLEGTLHLESKKNIGSTFIVEIPLKVKQASTENIEENTIEKIENSEFKNLNILLFEDNETNSDLMIKRIEKMGVASVKAALNGKEGLEILKKEKFDLILMDIQMPILNGIDTTKLIRTSAIGQNSSTIPVIGLSANSFQEDIDLAMEAGMDDYLSKPAKREELREVFLKYVKKAIG